MSLLERLSAGKWEKITIQCHNNPDADTIASGFALYSYLKDRGKSPQLVYSGWDEISKPNLNLMIKLCDISALKYVPAGGTEKSDLLITVDCQPGESNVAPLAGETVAVIDHHSVSVPKCKLSVDMTLSRFRSYDSCAAILWELLAEANYTPDKNLATALYYGLYMDTNYFKRLRHPTDKKMMSDLGTAKVDHEIFDQLQSCNFTKEEIRTIGAALANTSFHGKLPFAVVEAPDCDRNLLGAISDQMMETEGVNVCLVYCMNDKGVPLSARSYEPKILANRLMGQIALGLGGGGGTEDKAGGFMSRENLQTAFPDTSRENLNADIGRLISQRLADCLEQGKASEEEPWKWSAKSDPIPELTRSAEDGDIVAQCHLGICHAKGWGVAQSREDAFKWYMTAARRDMWAELDANKNHPNNQEWEMLREERIKAWALAQRMVGVCFSTGRGADREIQTAAEWYRKAAENGDDHGQLNLARYYAREEVERASDELAAELAAEWLHRAAGQGYKWAQKELADCYAGVEQDLKFCFRQDWALAAYWYEMAAKKGNVEAMEELAKCYEQGLGVPTDQEKAAQWRKKADDMRISAL